MIDWSTIYRLFNNNKYLINLSMFFFSVNSKYVTESSEIFFDKDWQFKSLTWLQIC